MALAVGCVSDGDSDSDADPGRPNSGEVVRGEGEGEGEGPAEGEGEGPAEGEGEDPAEGEGEGPAEGEGEGPAEGEGEGEGPAEGEGEGEGPGLACPAPGDCDPAVDAVEGELTPLDRCRFGWTPPDDWEGGMARVAALADRLPVVGWGDVLAQLNRRTRGAGATNRTAIPQLADGFTWNEGDDNVDYWMPQGVTGSSDAAADGLVAGRRLLLVSWYHKDAQGGGAQRGVRVSVVDWNLVGRPVDDYRHLLLVEPTVGPDGVPNFRAVEIHAGGIAWVGRWLFVADTGHGLRVFDMERVMEVATGEDHMGRQGERWYARGYRYIIPQVERYDALPEPEGCPVRFSFVGLDRSTRPLSLVTGEYHADDRRARVLRWHLDPETGLPLAGPDGTPPVEVHLVGRTKVQGAVSWNGAWYLSCSSQWTRFGRLYRTGPGFDGGWLAWAYGAEDLYHERDRGLLWTPAEHAGTRDVVAVPRAAFQ